jgi:hypothetical protein
MFEGRHLQWKYWEPRSDWQGSRSLADAIVTSDGAPAAMRLLPLLGFADCGTVVTQYARPIGPLLYLTGSA